MSLPVTDRQDCLPGPSLEQRALHGAVRVRDLPVHAAPRLRRPCWRGRSITPDARRRGSLTTRAAAIDDQDEGARARRELPEPSAPTTSRSRRPWGPSRFRLRRQAGAEVVEPVEVRATEVEGGRADGARQAAEAEVRPHRPSRRRAARRRAGDACAVALAHRDARDATARPAGPRRLPAPPRPRRGWVRRCPRHPTSWGRRSGTSRDGRQHGRAGACVRVTSRDARPGSGRPRRSRAAWPARCR